MYFVSDKDKEILYHLDLDSRKSFRKIAKEVNLPQNTFGYRVKKLQEKHIITRFYTVINSYNLEFSVIKFYANFANIDSNIKRKIIEYFSLLKNTWVVSSLEGKFNLSVIFWIRNIEEFYSIWKTIFSDFNKYLLNTKFYFQYEALSFRPTYLIKQEFRDKNEPYDISKKEKQVHIDEISISLLQNLVSESRISTIQLSKLLNISIGSTINRMKELKNDNIIQSYRIAIDVSKFGYLHIKTDVFLNNINDNNKISEYFKKCSYVVCIMKSIGYPHIEIEFNVNSVKHFHQIMSDFMDNNPDIIKYYTYFQVLETHKLRWMPDILC